MCVHVHCLWIVFASRVVLAFVWRAVRGCLAKPLPITLSCRCGLFACFFFNTYVSALPVVCWCVVFPICLRLALGCCSH